MVDLEKAKKHEDKKHFAGDGASWPCFLLELLLFPFVLSFYAIKLYFLGCIKSLLIRWWVKLFYMCCHCKCMIYTDQEFPAGDDAVGEPRYVEAVLANGAGGRGTIEWQRASVIAKNQKIKNRMRLFPRRGIHAGNIQQGVLADCWLISSLACLAERPGAIEAIFLTKQYNPFGKYKIRLFLNFKWQVIEVDDMFPVFSNDNTPCFGFPHNHATYLWPIILEKAFAKVMGSYQELDGGFAAFAMQVGTRV